MDCRIIALSFSNGNGGYVIGKKPLKPKPLSSSWEGGSFSVFKFKGMDAGAEPIALRLMRSVMSFLIFRGLGGLPLLAATAETFGF
jgi:hypothetical protein